MFLQTVTGLSNDNHPDTEDLESYVLSRSFPSGLEEHLSTCEPCRLLCVDLEREANEIRDAFN